MSNIKIVNDPEESMLTSLGVRGWPIWQKEESEFPWYYSDAETCYLLEGDVEVTPEGGDPVRFTAGDLVSFPKGMHCTWKIFSAVRKHYIFE